MLANDIGPRGTHNPKAYATARAFLASALRDAGYEVVQHEFVAMDVLCANLEAVAPGRGGGDRDQRTSLVVGAHYDSVAGCPAANDNASGVAGVLAMARRMRHHDCRMDIRFVLFANEEPPFYNMNDMGSQRYARRCRADRHAIAGMVCLETIGCYSTARGSQRWPHPLMGKVLPTVGDFLCMVGPVSARGFIAAAARAFTRQGAFPLLAAALPSVIQQINWSDHRGFNEVGYPAFMLTDTAPFRYGHYHRPTDTPEKLEYLAMARVVSGAIGMVRELAR